MMSGGAQPPKSGLIPPIRYSVADGYPHRSQLSIDGKPLRVVSPLPFNQQQVSTLDNYLKLLPPDLKDLIQQRKEDFSIALSSRRELRAIAGGSTFGAYDRTTKLIYLPIEDLGLEVRTQSVDTIRHETIHAAVDSLVQDSPAVKSLFTASRFFRMTQFMFQDFFEKWYRSETAGTLSFLSSIFLFLAPTSIGGFFLTRKFIPKQMRLPITLGSLAICAIGVVSLYYDAKRCYPDGRGIIKDEYKRFKKAPDSKINPLRLTVSSHAADSVAEFSAETMQAYLQEEKEGYSDGTKTREGLALKHPRLFLAYAAFFDPVSPRRFSAEVLDEVRMIDDILAKNRKPDGSYDLTRAQQSFFEKLQR